MTMHYRRLGASGLQVSALSLGSWITYHNQVDTGGAREMLAAAMDAGVNFFDNAEVYALGKSESVMGDAIKGLKEYVAQWAKSWGKDGLLAKAGMVVAPDAVQAASAKAASEFATLDGASLK